jgi:hypothetical protein
LLTEAPQRIYAIGAARKILISDKELDMIRCHFPQPLNSDPMLATKVSKTEALYITNDLQYSI